MYLSLDIFNVLAGLIDPLKFLLNSLAADLGEDKHYLNIGFSELFKHPSQVGVNHEATEVRELSRLRFDALQ